MEETQEQTDAAAPSAAMQREIGPYVLLRELGRGGAATVYKALDTRDKSVVALKALASVPYNQDADQMALLVRMERETRAVEGLSHPHIVRILDVGFAGDSPQNLVPYFAMEFLSGETLRQRLDRDGALPLPVAARILDQSADALDAVHASGVVHRDVKPGNLMLMKDNFVKLMDFGIARQSDDATVTRAGMMVGSPAYMSPEQAVGESATPAADIWGLSVVLFEMVTGQPPFTGANIPAILYAIRHGEVLTAPEGVPAAVSGVLLRALDRDAHRRYATAMELAAAFHRAVESQKSVRAELPSLAPQSAAATLSTSPPSKKKGRSIHGRFAIAFASPIIVIAVIVAGGVIANVRRTGSARPQSTASRHSAATGSHASEIEIEAPAAARKREAQELVRNKSPKPELKIAAPLHPTPSAPRVAPSRPQGSEIQIAKLTQQTMPAKAASPRPAAAKPIASPGQLAAAAAGSQSGGVVPQPQPAPGIVPPPASSSSAAPLAASASPTADKSSSPAGSLSGVWHGTYDSRPALLVLNRPDSDDGVFDGTLTVRVAKGSVLIDVRGSVGPGGKLQFREQEIIGAAPAPWSLGSATGSATGAGAISGGGRAADGHAFGWSFHR